MDENQLINAAMPNEATAAPESTVGELLKENESLKAQVLTLQKDEKDTRYWYDYYRNESHKHQAKIARLEEMLKAIKSIVCLILNGDVDEAH